jgi:hypothetical protein
VFILDFVGQFLNETYSRKANPTLAFGLVGCEY